MFPYYSCHHHVTNTITEILRQVFERIFLILNIQWENTQLLYSLEVCYFLTICHNLRPCIRCVHTQLCRASTKETHVTLFPRQGLKCYAELQIHKRDMQPSPKILKGKNNCKLCDGVESVWRTWDLGPNGIVPNGYLGVKTWIQIMWNSERSN